MEWEAIIIAFLSLMGTLGGSYFSNMKSRALISYRLDQIEKKQDAHNRLIERTYELEETAAIHTEKFKVVDHRIEDLEKLMK